MVCTRPFPLGIVLCDLGGREDWRTEEQRRDWGGQAEVRREDGESEEEAIVGGKDSAAREVGENVMGMVVAVEVLK